MRIRIALATLTALTACQQGGAPADDPAEEKTAASANAGSSADETNAANSGRPFPASADGRISRYSSLGKDNCRLIEESNEGPYWRMRCGGIGGYSVDYTESDLRQNITVFAPNGTKASLDLPSKVAMGAFDSLGPRIEWRGDAGEAPDSLIARVNIAREGGPDRSVLAIAKLSPTPCIIDVVEPGAGQNGRAQTFADKGGACVA